MTIETLRAHRRGNSERRLSVGKAWHNDDFVFDRGDGWYDHPDIVSRGFPLLCEVASVPRIRFHDFRQHSWQF